MRADLGVSATISIPPRYRSASRRRRRPNSPLGQPVRLRGVPAARRTRVDRGRFHVGRPDTVGRGAVDPTAASDPAGTLLEARREPTATTLSDGRVLSSAGSRTPSRTTTPNVRIQVTSTFSATGSLPVLGIGRRRPCHGRLVVGRENPEEPGGGYRRSRAVPGDRVVGIRRPWRWPRDTATLLPEPTPASDWTRSAYETALAFERSARKTWGVTVPSKVAYLYGYGCPDVLARRVHRDHRRWRYWQRQRPRHGRRQST